MTTIQIVWLNERGAAAVSIPWAQIQKDQYSKFNPTKAVDIVSLALTTVMTAKPVVFTLLGPSDSSRRELERIKVVIRDAVKNASRKRGSSRLAWLEADKALFKEYVELVRDGKVIDEEDFWRGKESMLSGFDSSRAVAEKGPLTALFADDTEVDDKGKMKVKINPEIIHNIFRLYPAVAKAYKDNVPEKMTEKEFWTKYFRSEYYARDKGSSAPDRISGRRAVLQTDDMFQRYDNEMAVAAIGHEKSATDVMAAKRLADMSSEINLISTYNDYHSSERLESFDVPTDISSNPVVSKYIRNTNLIVESMISVNGNSTASYCSGGKSSAELSEQFIDYGPDFIEMPALHAKLDGLASQSDDLVDEPLRKKVRMKEKLTAKNIINGAAAIFQDLSVVGDTGSSGHASGSLIQNQDQDLYIMLSSFPNGFKEVSRFATYRFCFLFNYLAVYIGTI